MSFASLGLGWYNRRLLQFVQSWAIPLGFAIVVSGYIDNMASILGERT